MADELFKASAFKITKQELQSIDSFRKDKNTCFYDDNHYYCLQYYTSMANINVSVWGCHKNLSYMRK